MAQDIDHLAGADFARPPATDRGILGWAQRNLFSTWYNSLLTLLAIYFVVVVGSGLLRWAFVDSVWTGTAEECHAAAGACWAVIVEKHRFILFGTYPFQEQWRPLIAVVLFIAMIGVSCWRRLWGRWLMVAWAVAFVLMAWLIRGGVFGLRTVTSENWGGLPLTLILSIVGIVVAFPLAILLALGRRSDMPVIRALCIAYIELIRGVPLISVLFMASVMFPLFLPEGVTIDKVLRAQIGFLLFSAAYLAEVIRAGLQALPKGQYEAADSLGLSYWKKMRLIVLPQALKIVIPPLVNSFIATFKDTSLVIIIGLYDLLNTTKTAINDPVWRSFYVEGYVFVAAIFFCFCFFMSKYSQYLEKARTSGPQR